MAATLLIRMARVESAKADLRVRHPVAEEDRGHKPADPGRASPVGAAPAVQGPAVQGPVKAKEPVAAASK